MPRQVLYQTIPSGHQPTFHQIYNTHCLPQVCGARIAAEQRVKSLKDLSWAKANVLLSTAYGQKAMHGVDSGATYAMQLLDHYLPPVAQDAPATGECL